MTTCEKAWEIDLQRRGSFDQVQLATVEEFTASCINEKNHSLSKLFQTIYEIENPSAVINNKKFTELHMSDEALEKIIDDEVAQKPIVDVQVKKEKKLSLHLGHQTASEFIKSVSSRTTPENRAHIRQAILNKTDQHREPIVDELFKYYEKASISHIPHYEKGFVETFFAPESEHTGLEADLVFKPTKQRPRLALSKDTSKHEITVQINTIKEKLKKLRDQHLVVFNQIADFLIAEGQYFLSKEDQEDLIEEIYILFTNRQKLYFDKDQNLTRAALYLDSIEQLEKMVLETKTSVMQFKRKINEETGGKLIVWIEEQKKACEEVLKAEELPEVVQEKAKLVINHCKTTIEFIDKLVQPHDEPHMKGRANITVHGDLIQKVDISNSPGSNVAQGVIQYGNITQKTYVQQASAAHALEGASSIMNTLLNALGAGFVAGISGLVLGHGIPVMLSNGLAAATDALIRPLATETAKKFGLSDTASYAVGLTASLGVSTYTASTITSLLNRGAVQPPPIETPADKPAETMKTEAVKNEPVKNENVVYAQEPPVNQVPTGMRTASVINDFLFQRKPTSWGH